MDFQSVGGQRVFQPGDSTRTFSVQTAGDKVKEPDKKFCARILLADGSPGSVGRATGIGTIVDDDSAPVVSIDDVRVTEAGVATFTVTFSNPSEACTADRLLCGASVRWAAVPGSAVAPADFTAASGTVAMAPPDESFHYRLSYTVSVPLAGDSLDEPDEQFTGRLSSAQLATIGRGTERPRSWTTTRRRPPRPVTQQAVLHGRRRGAGRRREPGVESGDRLVRVRADDLVRRRDARGGPAGRRNRAGHERGTWQVSGSVPATTSVWSPRARPGRPTAPTGRSTTTYPPAEATPARRPSVTHRLRRLPGQPGRTGWTDRLVRVRADDRLRERDRAEADRRGRARERGGGHAVRARPPGPPTTTDSSSGGAARWPPAADGTFATGSRVQAPAPRKKPKPKPKPKPPSFSASPTGAVSGAAVTFAVRCIKAQPSCRGTIALDAATRALTGAAGQSTGRDREGRVHPKARRRGQRAGAHRPAGGRGRAEARLPVIATITVRDAAANATRTMRVTLTVPRMRKP